MLVRLRKIFHDAKAYAGMHEERKKKRHEFTRRVRDLVDYHMDDPALAEFRTKLDNVAYGLFLFIAELRVPHDQPRREPAARAGRTAQDTGRAAIAGRSQGVLLPHDLQGDLGDARPAPPGRDQESSDLLRHLILPRLTPGGA